MGCATAATGGIPTLRGARRSRRARERRRTSTQHWRGHGGWVCAGNRARRARRALASSACDTRPCAHKARGEHAVHRVQQTPCPLRLAGAAGGVARPRVAAEDLAAALYSTASAGAGALSAQGDVGPRGGTCTHLDETSRRPRRVGLARQRRWGCGEDRAGKGEDTRRGRAPM
ncbi:hypothetical protein PsYK624_066920 [Phanerochaete sordida]|uniref:Uncharacterized protein n=1 Tax=Phanerochaete sordida TaxID=48140 RepID=A0A9P3LCT5_9APHY|nr:hypothetical protein PsYK624_066920 [Phanerochaete sordida]